MIILLITLQIMPHIKPAYPFYSKNVSFNMVFSSEIGFTGNFRNALSQRADFGISGVLFFTPFAGIQGDINFLLHKKNSDIPFNISFYPMANFGFGENLVYFSASANIEFDFPFKLEEENIRVVPYVLMGLGGETVNFKTGTETITESSLEAHASFGIFFILTRKLAIPVELHFSDSEKRINDLYFSAGVMFGL